jgi:hypothetical protein
MDSQAELEHEHEHGKQHQNQMMENTSLQMVDYSDKSFAVLGNTRTFSSQLKDMGGRFNRYLTVNNQKVPGWIFPKTRQEEVTRFILDANSGSLQSTSLPSNEQNTDLPTVEPPRGAGQHYQIVRFKVYKPREGMKVTLKTEGAATMHGEVIKTEVTDGIVDAVYMRFGEQTTFACICRGKWQVFGYNKNHSLFFTE